MTIVEMQMNIDCDGCEDNVRKALLRLRGVDYVDVDRARGKVTVTGSASQKKVLRAARRTGRLAVLWPSAYNTEHHHQTYYAQPQPAAYYQYQHHQYQAKAAAAAAGAHAHHYQQFSSVQHGKSGGGWMAQPRTYNPKASSYNYRVHGYFDSDLHGYSHMHLEHAEVVPAAARSYFSDENPHACAVM